MYKYCISYNQYSNAHYTTFLSEAEYHICLLCACVFNYVYYLVLSELDTVSVKTKRKFVTFSESAEDIALVLFIFILHKIGFVWHRN